MSLALDPNDPAALGPSAAPANLIKDSDTANFGADVIEPSMEVPVIVDFWAPWCGPCKQLGPLLEKLVTQAGGLVRMVKINVDENKELAGQLRIQSIPAVFAFKDGQPADGFVGAQTERQIKDFIGRLIGDAKTPLDAALEQAKAAFEDGNIDVAGPIYMDVMRQDPENAEAIAGLIRCSITIGKLEHAQEIIGQLDDKIKAAPEVAAAISALELAEQRLTYGKRLKPIPPITKAALILPWRIMALSKTKKHYVSFWNFSGATALGTMKPQKNKC